MIRLFSLFVDWCAGRNLQAGDYQIVIVPKSADAEARLKLAWGKEFAHLSWDRPEVGGLYDGMMYGVPFRIESFRTSPDCTCTCSLSSFGMDVDRCPVHGEGCA